jgi:arylsulfatase A-like enzyme
MLYLINDFMKKWLFGLLALIVLQSSHYTKAKTPNIVLIFMDDMGYGDVGCYGAVDFETPNMDRMAAQGVRFTNFLTTQAVCSASRAALLTGCYPNRLGMFGALGPNSKTGLNPSETTLAEVLRQRGYKTGIVGKWHLGDHHDFLPLQQGFDEYTGLPYSNDMWPMYFDGKPATKQQFMSMYPTLPIMQNNEKKDSVKTLDDQAKLTTLYTEKAVDFIRRHKKQPFFLYLPHSMPHVPIAASAQFKGKSKQGLYGDMMMELDWSVGQVLKALKTNGLDKNTLVILTSDNGPWLNFGNHAGSAGGFREGKGTTFEGGHRVPCLVQWKGYAPAGRVCNQLATTLDLLPTIAHICNAPLPLAPIDGVNILPLLQGKCTESPRKAFYYYYRRNNLEAVRLDNWKLVLPHPGRSYENAMPGSDGLFGKVDDNTPFPMALYDLRRDPSERYDVQTMYPDIVAKLQQLAETARQDLGDDLTNRKGSNLRPVGTIK